METGGDNLDPAPLRPGAKPPPLPPISPLAYRAIPAGSVAWLAAASFPNSNQWHEANRILSRHGIVGRMRPAEGDMVGFDLLVLATEVEWARDLIAHAAEGADHSSRFTRGFPMDEVNIETAADPSQIRAIPVEERGLSPQQRTTYTVLIVLLWIVLLVVLVLTVLGVVYMSNY
jgi:hypothetical protein